MAFKLGRLSGYRYRDIIRNLKLFGFEFYRQAAGRHEIWHNPETNRFTTVPNHSDDMPEGTLRAILTQAGIDVQEFNELPRSKLRGILSIKKCTLLPL